MTSFDEIAAMAARLRRGFLVTRRQGGSPTVHPLTPIYDESGLYINTYRKSAKVQNLLRSQQMAYVVMTRDEDGGPPRAFEARGIARILDIGEVPEAFLAVGTAGDAIRQEDLDRVRARLASGKRVYLKVEANDWAECEPVAPPGASECGSGGSGWDDVAVGGKIAMSGTEIDAFLGRSGTAVLGTVDRRGRPRGRPARYLNRRGRLDLLLGGSSPSLGDFESSPMVCATVEEFPTYDEIRGVMAHGRIHGTEDPAPAGWVRVVLEPDRVVSFDFSKIAASR